MAYFEENYRNISLPIDKGTDVTRGLRRAQIGAVHAIASHFTLKSEPAIVVMPTGSGKTAVLLISAYLLEAKRVLVVTPSRLVRNEIANQFSDLSILKRIQVVPEEITSPSVHEQVVKISSLDDWEGLRNFDVVVASPTSVSPGIADIPSPPENLFDLILVDEAHHSPARIWDQLFSSFPKAKRLLVTATPFRRDKREINGRFIYTYPLKEAYKDNVFGKIEFVAVTPNGRNHDVAIAQEAQRIFIRDKERELHHAIMVRTDSMKKANELRAVYEEHAPRLRLKVIHSGLSYGYIKKTIGHLRKRELDGVICVNMMGEGFDFPNLKIAAIHTPHKSLAITLQFIGRFARTNAGDVDIATFLAVPSEIQVESTKLYDQDVAWQEMIINLSRTRIDQEMFIQETLQDFQKREDVVADQPNDVSMYTLRPFGHVKIYKITGDVNVFNEINLPDEFEIANAWDHIELNASVVIAKELKKPKWSAGDRFTSTVYHLLVFYYDVDSHLLFINSTLKQTELYEDLARSFATGTPKILPLNRINKVLLSLENPAFYNVGMKNRLQSATAESYKNITGPAAQKAISESDGQLYHRGHVFGGDANSTIGFSSSSKVWSNARFLVPNLIQWCQNIAIHLTSNSEVITNSPLDYLNVGQDITEFPEGVIGALWELSVFKNPPRVQYIHQGQRFECSLLDINLSVDQKESTTNSLRLIVSNHAFRIEMDYHLNASTWFTAADESNLNSLDVIRSHKNVSILEYLNANPPEFFFGNFSRLYGSELFPGPSGEAPSLRDDQFSIVNWGGNNVDIETEFGNCSNGKMSIHSYLERELPSSSDIVFYDHKNGEIADFISFRQEIDTLEIVFYHCKGSGGENAGARVKDYYEVCMQVVKSLNWIENNKRLLTQIEYREDNVGSRFIKGSRTELREMIQQSRFIKTKYRLVLVQPGISHSKIDELAILLSAAGDYVSKSRGQDFTVWCSS